MKKKNLAAWLMAGAMCFSLLAGCSSQGGEASTPPASQPVDTQPPATGPAEPDPQPTQAGEPAGGDWGETPE